MPPVSGNRAATTEFLERLERDTTLGRLAEELAEDLAEFSVAG